MEMWLSKRVMADRDAENPATLGTVSIGGKNPAVVTDAEKRQAKVISPGGYCWNPAATDCVLVVKGNELYVAGMPQEGTKGLRAGEVMLFSEGASVKVNMKSVFPWFILGFLALSGLTSLGLIPGSVSSALKTLSKFLMVAALGAVGLNTDFKALCKSGAKPMLHGFIISLLVVLVAIGVEYMLGIAPTGTLA